MKKIKTTKIVNSLQSELNRLKQNVDIYKNLECMVNNLKKQFSANNLTASFSISDLDHALRLTLIKLGEVYAENSQQIVSVEVEREPLTIYGKQFKIGDKVRLTDNEIEYFNERCSIKKHGRVSGFGTVVFKCIGNQDNGPSNTTPTLDLDLYICFSSGQTLRIPSHEVFKIKSKKENKKTELVLVDEKIGA